MAAKHFPTIKLSDGNSMPILGFGTSSVLGKDLNDPGFVTLVNAIKSGYRFIDTAAVYKNEEIVGQAIHHCIEQGIVERDDLFICTKVWSTFHKRALVVKSCEESLKRLNLNYVDLLLVHWPMGFKEDSNSFCPVDEKTGKLIYSDVHFTETWQGMEDVKDAGLSKSIGVSNFNHQMIDELLKMCKHKPVVNQIECHPYLCQKKLHHYSKEHGIILNAYCPLGSPNSCAQPDQPVLLEDPTIKELSTKYNKTPAQILIRFLIQRQIPPIPKSVTLSRIQENANVFDFEINQIDMDKIMSLDRNLRYCIKTAGFKCPDHPFYPFHEEY